MRRKLISAALTFTLIFSQVSLIYAEDEVPETTEEVVTEEPLQEYDGYIAANEVEKVSEDTGGSHYDNGTVVPIEPIPYVQNEDGTFTILTNEVDSSYGGISSSNTNGFWSYDKDGNIVVNSINDNSSITVGKDWGSRLYEFDFVYTKSPTEGEYINKETMLGVPQNRTAIAIKGEDLSTAKEYTSELEDGKLITTEYEQTGVKPRVSNDYYYNGSMTVQYTEGGDSNWIYYSREGENLTDWDKTADWNLKVDAETGEVTGLGTALTGNEYFSVVYQYLLYHKLNYSINDNSDTPDYIVEKIKYDEAVEIASSDTFEKDGYEFKGWNSEKDGSGEIYNEKDIINMPYSNINLYAIWEKKAAPPPIDDGGSDDSDDNYTPTEPKPNDPVEPEPEPAPEPVDPVIVDPEPEVVEPVENPPMDDIIEVEDKTAPAEIANYSGVPRTGDDIRFIAYPLGIIIIMLLVVVISIIKNKKKF